MMRRWSLLASMFCLLCGLAGTALAEFSDKAVENAIKRGIGYLWSEQLNDGTWGPFGKPKGINYSVTGPTAIVVYALLESEVNPQDPRMAKALEWLMEQKEDSTYALGLRANAWLAANRQSQGKYFRYLEKDAKQIWNGAHNGAFDYRCDQKPSARWDNSNSQYGVLGAWAAAQGNAEVPRQFWTVVMAHWEKCQCRDGGWGYQGSASAAAMTAGGVATLFVCVDNVHAEEFVKCQGNVTYRPIKGGLDWLDKNFAQTMQGKVLGHSDMFYYLYALERVGLASGYKYFGKSDWYKEGATFLVRTQGNDGGWKGKWGGPVATAYALLFLIRGRHAVVFNKLEYDGDWNNRPRDLASVTRWMSRTFERTVNWQIINLHVSVSEWHDAPILYIAGSREPKFTQEELNKLRTFVLQGGAIFSTTECGGAAFKKGIAETYAKLFPKYELTPAGPTHDIYSRKVHFELEGRPRFSIVSNGVRPLVIHTDFDLPMAWQLRKVATQKWAFEAAANTVKYVTDSVSLLRPRGTSHWPEPPAAKGDRTIKLVRLKHSGSYDPEALAYERFARLMGNLAKTNLDVVGPVEIKELAQSDAKVAALTGTGKLSLRKEEQEILKTFVSKGGTVVIDAAGGSREFAESAEETIKGMYGPRELRPLALSASIYRLKGMEIDKVQYRRQTRVRLGSTRSPNLRAVLIGERAGVILSPEDLTAGLVGYPSYTVDGYEPESAYEIMRNIVLSSAGPLREASEAPKAAAQGEPAAPSKPRKPGAAAKRAK